MNLLGPIDNLIRFFWGGVTFIQVACNTSEAIQKQLIALDSDANDVLKACLEELEGGADASASKITPRTVRIRLSVEISCL